MIANTTPAPDSYPDTAPAPSINPPAPERIVLFGAGNIAATVHTLMEHDGAYEIVAFTVDREHLDGEEFMGLPLVPFDAIEARFPPGEFAMHIAVSFRDLNQVRADGFERARAKGYRLVTFSNSRATICPNTQIGLNCRIGINCVIQPFVKVGDNVIIGDGTIVGHHTVIEDHCFLSSNISIGGEAEIGTRCFLGMHSVIRNAVQIAPRTVVGAGAVILANTAEKSVYMAEAAEPLPITSDDLPLR